MKTSDRHSMLLANDEYSEFYIMNFQPISFAGKLNDVITDADWKEIVRKRSGSATRRALLKALNDLKADIVAHIQVDREK